MFVEEIIKRIPRIQTGVFEERPRGGPQLLPFCVFLSLFVLFLVFAFFVTCDFFSPISCIVASQFILVPLFFKLRYESSTLILYKELSSSIFQM